MILYNIINTNNMNIMKEDRYFIPRIYQELEHAQIKYNEYEEYKFCFYNVKDYNHALKIYENLQTEFRAKEFNDLVNEDKRENDREYDKIDPKDKFVVKRKFKK